MANLIDIRRRIKSVKNTQQITKAMKMVAASKLRRAQDRVIAARPYATTLEAALASEKGALLDEIRSAPKLTKELEEKIAAAVGEAKKLFLADNPAAKA